MAGCIFTASNTSEALLASSSGKTVVKIMTSTNQAIKIKEWGVFFDGVSVTAEPVLVRLCDYTTAEVVASFVTTHTPQLRAGRTIISRALIYCTNTSSSHGMGKDYAVRNIHPQSGYQEKFSYGDEITVANGSAIGIHVTSATTVNVVAEITYEE